MERLTMTDGTVLELVGRPGGATFNDEADGLDPAMLAWAARWCVSLATLTGQGFMVYERDGFGDLQLVGVDPDFGILDASDSLERLRACSRALERRGLASLGFGLAASHGAPAAPREPVRWHPERVVEGFHLGCPAGLREAWGQ